eukprot:363662-Chlamydomonas_euryale.AAC.16
MQTIHNKSILGRGARAVGTPARIARRVNFKAGASKFENVEMQPPDVRVELWNGHDRVCQLALCFRRLQIPDRRLTTTLVCMIVVAYPWRQRSVQEEHVPGEAQPGSRCLSDR